MSLNYHQGMRFQRGRGLGSIFGGLMRFLRPLASMGISAGKKFLSSDIAKNIGSAALDVGKSAVTNMAVDLLEGRNMKESASENLENAKKVIASTLKGGGCKRKRKRPQNPCSKKAKYNLLE